MIKVNSLIKTLKKNKVDFFSGVPDTITKELSKFLEYKNKSTHIMAANEGSAVSIATGYHLATGKMPCVYMQNSGLSNAINPLISIAHKKVYSIPIFLIIGWRGSPNSNDEPQHNVKGKITKEILDLMNIKYVVINNEKDLKKLNNLIKYGKRKNEPIACLVKKGILINHKTNHKKIISNNNQLNKIHFLEKLLKLAKNYKIISSTGYNSREIMKIKKQFSLNNSDFYLVGGMGHTASTSLGYSLFSKSKNLCIDGDGSMIMHLGSFVSLNNYANKNFKYVMFNNNSHNSVGGQKTNVDKIDIKSLSNAFGFSKYILIKKKNEIDSKLKIFFKEKGPIFLEVKVSNKTLNDLPRPDNLVKIKKNFMKK